MSRRPVHQLGGGFQRQPDIVWLTETEAAHVCRYFDRGCAHPVRAFQQWARRVGMPCKRAGRARLYDPRVVEAFLEREAWTLRHARRFPVKPVTKLAVAHDASVGSLGAEG